MFPVHRDLNRPRQQYANPQRAKVMPRHAPNLHLDNVCHLDLHRIQNQPGLPRYNQQLLECLIQSRQSIPLYIHTRVEFLHRLLAEGETQRLRFSLL